MADEDDNGRVLLKEILFRELESSSEDLFNAYNEVDMFSRKGYDRME